ncbi:MAG: GNAT family N-acetyltransferase [Clostridia bacterium]|nr:GNAT family N-acetyltransferase [Clostridia bacterium]
MEKKLLSEEEKIKYHRDEILEMMRISDKDFVPPLSSRTSTTQSNLSGDGSGGIELYFNEMIKQKVLGAFEGDRLFGIVSFRENYETDIIKDLPNIYISTLFLHPDSRGRGVTKELYSYLFFDLYKNSNIFTRTWSANVAHIKILDFFGFELFHRIENDRGDGIDTVYFRRLVNSED